MPMRPQWIQENKSLKPLNWWKVGGEARFFGAPVDATQLHQAWVWAVDQNLPVHVISGGSNVLVKDGVIEGLTLSLHDMKGILETEETADGFLRVVCLAGTPKSELAKIFLQKRLAPAVFLTGIPGDVGGGVVMNAGVGEARIPREFCEIVDWIEVLHPSTTAPEILRLSKDQIHWEYRHSSGWQPGIITKVAVRWPLQPDMGVMNEVREATKKRVSTQPLNQPSCGSVFRNPPGQKSAKLIQDCGLKGFRVGGAQVSEKHANFIVNDGQALAEDVRQVILHVRKTVQEKTGIQLQTEVIPFGGWTLF